MGAAQKLIVREVTFEEENGARKRRENRRGIEGESRKMEVRARGGERRVYEREKEKEKKEKERGETGKEGIAKGDERSSWLVARKRRKEGVKAALQYPTLANRSAIHWSVRVIPGSFGK